MSSHLVSSGITVIMAEVEDETAFAGMLKAPDFSEQLWAFAWEHGSIDDLNRASCVHADNLIYNLFLEVNVFQIFLTNPYLILYSHFYQQALLLINTQLTLSSTCFLLIWLDYVDCLMEFIVF